jgi:hypothetical protein
MLAPDAFAQAPAAKVTITGLVDNVTSYTKNLSVIDLNVSRDNDTEWYARTRVRPDITAELGTTKFVLGLEIDHAWGQTGATDNTAPNRFGTTHSLDLNTDALGVIEMKWAYTEFNIPGIPFATRVRLGAQPWAATYKVSALATGDFGGVHVTSTLAPPVKLNFTYAQVEEESTGPRDGFARGEDWAIIASAEITPFKGLDIRPIYSYFRADGATSGAARQNRGGVTNGAATVLVVPVVPGVVAAPIAVPVAGIAAAGLEQRHTIGIDARFRGGPFSLDPTFFYQWGTREIDEAGFVGARSRQEQDMKAWFVDVRGGFQAGPLLIEGAVIYTTGNKAQDDIRNAGEDVRFYQPISTDTSFYSGWAEHWALGIDYFNIIYAASGGNDPGVAIGYDKYGLFRLGARASYAVTPAFTVRTAVTANWTAEKVDTDNSGISATTGNVQPAGEQSGGDSRYLGTELDLGFQWRLAPGLALDVVGAYTWTGEALESAVAQGTNGVTRANNDREDIKTVTARVRYTF